MPLWSSSSCSCYSCGYDALTINAEISIDDLVEGVHIATGYGEIASGSNPSSGGQDQFEVKTIEFIEITGSCVAGRFIVDDSPAYGLVAARS